MKIARAYAASPEGVASPEVVTRRSSGSPPQTSSYSTPGVSHASAASTGPLGPRPEAVVPKRRLRGRSNELCQVRVVGLLRLRALDDRRFVDDLRLCGGAYRDHQRLPRHRLRVRDVHGARVGLAEHDLAKHVSDVGLVAD